MIVFLLNPAVFFSILGLVFFVSIVVVFIAFGQDNKHKKLDILLKEETAAKIELQKNIENLQQESERLKNELALKEKMYEGLKEQYNELERDFEKASQPSQQVSAAQDKPQGNEAAQAKTGEANPEHSIVNLLKSLNKIQKDQKEISQS